MVAIPLTGLVDIIIDWGDRTVSENVTTEGNVTHTYATAGIGDVSIVSIINRLGFELMSGS